MSKRNNAGQVLYLQNSEVLGAGQDRKNAHFKKTTKPRFGVKFSPKVRLNTVINQAEFVFWCMLYTYEGNEMRK